MSAALTIITLVLRVVGIVIGRLDEAEKKKAIAAMLDAARIKVENDVVERAVRAFDAARIDDGVRDTSRDYRD
jgi:predicted nucleotidyltransferase